MPVCKYFLEGRCRFGDNCWNEHPRGGGREQHHTAYSINRGSWGNQFQKHQSSYIQPSTFSKPATWGGGGRDVERRGFGCPDTGKKAISSSGSFVQNRFTTLSSDDQEHDLENLLEIVRKDIEAWEVSGQWLFSCYSVAKEYACVSGLVDFSPEELRLEYYNTRGGGSLQNYVDSIGQLSNQQRNRMLEIKKPNSSARISVSTELRKPNQQKAALGFGGVQTSTFGSSGFASSTASNNAFSFKPSTGLGNTTTASGFGSSSAPSVPPLSGFGTKPVPSSSAFGNTSTFGAPTTTAASTSAVFGTPATSSTPGTSVFGSSAPFGSNSTASSGFGNSASTCAPTSSTFGSTAKATTNAFGGTAASTTNAFGGTAASTTNAFGGTAASTTNAFGGTAASTTNAFGGTAASTTNAFGGIAATTTNALGGIAVPVSQPQNTSANNNTVSGCDKLYTPRTELSADDLREFEAKKFTLGRIPLRPPPIELLNV